MSMDRIAKTENDDSGDPVDYVVDVSFAVDKGLPVLESS